MYKHLQCGRLLKKCEARTMGTRLGISPSGHPNVRRAKSNSHLCEPKDTVQGLALVLTGATARRGAAQRSSRDVGGAALWVSSRAVGPDGAWSRVSGEGDSPSCMLGAELARPPSRPGSCMALCLHVPSRRALAYSKHCCLVLSGSTPSSAAVKPNWAPLSTARIRRQVHLMLYAELGR